ncbi:MAG: alkaline phosphatase family protein [Candidatus Hydrogenedentes bacterium]|nr:alkaline phosphatase family protein [Candidatus Hydrogenedentota bacterium]
MIKKLVSIALVGIVSSLCGAAESTSAQRVLLVVLDGLRPDYVTVERMPNLHALGERGVFFEEHHSTFPTVTRVNATSIVTGAYPERHGIMDNTVYFPEVDPDRGLSTGDHANLERIMAATGGKLLTAPDLGEVLSKAARALFVGSSGSSGSAFLLNHHVYNGVIVHNDYVLPEEAEAKVLELIGKAPEEGLPNAGQNHRAVDAYLKVGLDHVSAPVSILWISDPDHTAHDKGIGDPVTEEALRAVDGEVGRIVEGLKQRGLDVTTNILVTSDHGFATYGGKANASAVVKEFMEKSGHQAKDAVIAGAGIYLKKDQETLLPALVQRLQAEPWVGAIFTAGEAGSDQGGVPGTLSMELAREAHARAPHILVSPMWSDEKNAHGWPGTTDLPGVAGHGSAGRWEVHNTLIAAGPAFKQGIRSSVPSHNVDLAPTILNLQGLIAPDSMQGRVLEEALAGGPTPESVAVEKRTHQASTTLADGTKYEAELAESVVQGKTYLDFARAVRGGGK